jgi:hypothetical protein
MSEIDLASAQEIGCDLSETRFGLVWGEQALNILRTAAVGFLRPPGGPAPAWIEHLDFDCAVMAIFNLMLRGCHARLDLVYGGLLRCVQKPDHAATYGEIEVRRLSRPAIVD